MDAELAFPMFLWLLGAHNDQIMEPAGTAPLATLFFQETLSACALYGTRGASLSHSRSTGRKTPLPPRMCRVVSEHLLTFPAIPPIPHLSIANLQRLSTTRRSSRLSPSSRPLPWWLSVLSATSPPLAVCAPSPPCGPRTSPRRSSAASTRPGKCSVSLPPAKTDTCIDSRAWGIPTSPFALIWCASHSG